MSDSAFSPIEDLIASRDPAANAVDPGAEIVLTMIDRKAAAMLETRPKARQDRIRHRGMYALALSALAVTMAIFLVAIVAGGDGDVTDQPTTPPTVATTVPPAETDPAPTTRVSTIVDDTLDEDQSDIVDQFLSAYAEGSLRSLGVTVVGAPPVAERMLDEFEFYAGLNEEISVTSCSAITTIRCTGLASNEFLDALDRGRRSVEFTFGYDTDGGIRNLTFNANVEPMRSEWLAFAQWVAGENAADAALLAEFSDEGQALDPIYTPASANVGSRYLGAFVASRG